MILVYYSCKLIKVCLREGTASITILPSSSTRSSFELLEFTKHAWWCLSVEPLCISSASSKERSGSKSGKIFTIFYPNGSRSGLSMLHSCRDSMLLSSKRFEFIMSLCHVFSELVSLKARYLMRHCIISSM